MDKLKLITQRKQPKDMLIIKKNNAFPLRKMQVTGDTAIIIKNTGNNVYYSNSRIFISNKILYFLYCWDSCSLIFLQI